MSEWAQNSCETHGYAGVPPCPVPKCPNGSDQQVWIGCKVLGLCDRVSDSVVTMEERIFLRRRYHPHRNVGAEGWVWRELQDKVATP
jgi:hypothetical protein